MDDSYRGILPLLRPRSEDLSTLGIVAAALLATMVIAGVLAYLFGSFRVRVRMRRAFYAAALERGLTKAHVRLLIDLAKRQKIRDPLLLLSSLKMFDRIAGSIAKGDADSDDKRLTTMATIRRRLGFDAPSLSQRFHTTRTLQPGQTVMVWPEGAESGFLQCVIVHRDERCISAVPLLRADDRALSKLAAGDRIKARFWRRGDTEYRFRSEILNVPASTTSIQIRHAEKLERVQLRDFYRIKVDIATTLYALPRGLEVVPEDKLESVAVAKWPARIVDLSGGGAGLVAGEPVPDQSEVVIDPAFEGGFPLAGAQALLVGQHQKGDTWHIRIQFIGMTSAARDDLVAAIFNRPRKGIDN